VESLITNLYKSYGIYVNTEKMIPSSIDGTIPIWKRLLLGAHTIAKDQFVKSATLFGYVIGHWHPHSEAIQGTAQILVNNGFLIGKGNWGSNIGIEPTDCAAPRYTSLKSSKLIEELAFKYINDVDWIDSELEPEPIYLPTPIPLCLFGKTDFSMIGFGIKTEIPTYTLDDLFKRLRYLLNKGPEVVIQPFVDGCKVLSNKMELEKLLKSKGKHTIRVRGKYQIDEKNFRIYITGWSPRSNFITIFQRICKDVGGDNIVYVDESTEKTGTKIRIDITRTRNKEQLFEKLKKSVYHNLEANLTYQIYAASPDKKIVELSVDEYLLNSFNSFKKVVSRYVLRKKDEINKKIKDYQLILKLKPHLLKLSVCKNEDEIDSKISEISEKLSEDTETIQRILNEYKLRTLITSEFNIDKLKNEIQFLNEDLLVEEIFKINTNI